MTKITTKPDSSQPGSEMAVDLFDSSFDPIETEVRAAIDLDKTRFVPGNLVC